MPNIDEVAKVWQETIAERVGLAIQRRRGKLGLTAIALAELTAELGYPISRVAITKIEGNKRAGKLDIAELLTLSAALDVSPLSLMFPNVLDLIEILPGAELPGTDVLAWFLGLKGGPARPDGDDIDEDGFIYEVGDSRAGLAIELSKNSAALRKARSNLAIAERGLELVEARALSRERGVDIERAIVEDAKHRVELLEDADAKLTYAYRLLVDGSTGDDA